MKRAMALLPVLILVFSFLAIPAQAANGDGMIESFSPKAVTVGTSNPLTVVFYNDGDPDAPVCIDEIIIEAPDTWSTVDGEDVSVTYSLGPFTYTNEKDDGTYSGLVTDPKSVRIVPANPICPGGRAEITIEGLVAPDDPEYSTFRILTSDQNSNEPSDSKVRWPLLNQDSSCSGFGDQMTCSFMVRTTSATGLKIEYLHLDGTDPSAFSGKAWGAWARLDKLYVESASGSASAALYMDSNRDGICDPGTDLELWSGSLSAGVNTLTLDYSAWDNSYNKPGELYEGYVADQKTQKYCMTGVGAGETIRGHEDSPRDPIPSNADTGLTGAKGTILSVDEPGTRRYVNVQLVDENGYDVNEDLVPITATLANSIANVVDYGQLYTDASGNKYIEIAPTCQYGVEEVVFSSNIITPGNSVTEYIGINAGAPASYSVSPADGTEVVAGESQLITVTVYDSCGNVISDSPQQPRVDFDLLSTCGASLAQTDSMPPASQLHEAEQTTSGVADVYLVTGCEICNHEVQVEVEGLGTTLVNLQGVHGPPTKMVVTAPADGKMRADECKTVEIEVTDACGNRITEYYDPISGDYQQWTSLVRVELEGDDGTEPPEGIHIQSTTFAEEDIFSDGLVAQGKLTGGAATIEVCGCSELGEFWIVANSDTLQEGRDDLDIINSDPSCIDVKVEDSYLYACEEGTPVYVSIVDTCGNIMVDQDCNGAPAKSCINVSVEGEGASLSTDSVCVDVKTGFSDNLYLYRDAESCGEVNIVATDAPDCCNFDFSTLEQCAPATVTFIGEPEYIETKFEAVNPATQELVEQGMQKVSEEVKDVFTAYDACGNVVTDYYGTVDVELKGEDCTSFIEVQCNEPESIVADKIVIDNCAQEPDKDWLMIEKNDIVVDKLAFSVDNPPAGAWLYVYKENEKQAGFQMTGPNRDELVGKAPASPTTIIELRDHPFKPWQWDDQREGGVLIKAGDTKDFYVVVMSSDNEGQPIACGDVGVSYLYYQDYLTADITDFGYGGNVRDGFVGSDNFNWINPPFGAPSSNGGGTGDSRNDDYVNPSSNYPDPTPDYGFGDKVIYNLQFNAGVAWMKFRDLTAEKVKVYTRNVHGAGEVCRYDGPDRVEPNPEEITFVEQPATQVVLLNHDKDTEKIAACGEWDIEENGVYYNIQVTDGFQNPVPKADIEVEMDYCLKWPFGTRDIESIIEMYCSMPENELEEICDEAYFNNEYCFTKEDLKKVLKTEFADYFGDVLFGDFFGQEITEWIDKYFEDAKVTFYDKNGVPLPVGANGKQYVVTDANGQAEVYATSSAAGLFAIKAVPTALDADRSFAAFTAGIPEKLDIAALPAFGVPADGEEEAMLLIRALDRCGNIVPYFDGEITVTAVGDRHGTEQVKISQDFEGNNNYDNEVSGYLTGGFFSLIGFTPLAVLDDIPEVATITATSPGLLSDTTQVAFQGAPTQLKITSITPSDRLPADGMTGAWVTVQVQDRNGNRVTGYLGNGYAGDPGDPWGFTDYVFEDICVKLDDVEATLPPWMIGVNGARFGWLNLNPAGPGIYCGDLMFGEGQLYIVYGNPDYNHGGTVKVTVYDDQPWQGQEYNENGIPVSKQPTQLAPDSATIDYVDPATQWNAWSDRYVVLADGTSEAVITVQVENDYMDVRQAVEGNAYIGGEAESGATVKWVSPNGEVMDTLNPTSIRFITDPVTGKATLKVSSTKPGKAEITIVGGDAYVCDWRGGLRTLFNPLGDERYRNCRYSEKKDLRTKTIVVEFIEVADNELYLEAGWNFISTPYYLTTPKISDLFASIMGSVDAFWSWDASTQTWVPYDPLTTEMEPLNGYWVKMNSPAVVTLTYASSTMPSIPTKQVYPGWDTVGLTVSSPWNVKEALNSIDNSYSHLIGWDAFGQVYQFPISNTDADTPFSAKNSKMEPKKGYWIWVTAPTTLAGLTGM